LARDERRRAREARSLALSTLEKHQREGSKIVVDAGVDRKFSRMRTPLLQAVSTVLTFFRAKTSNLATLRDPDDSSNAVFTGVSSRRWQRGEKATTALMGFSLYTWFY